MNFTLADRFPDFPSFWHFLKNRKPNFISDAQEQLTAEWFAGVHYHYRAYTPYWPEEEEFINQFSTIICAQYVSICRKEKLYQQIFPKLSQMFKVKTTSRATSRSQDSSNTEIYDQPLYESPDYLIGNYGVHGRSDQAKSVTTSKRNQWSDTGIVGEQGQRVAENYSETEDKKGVSQVLSHFRELDTKVEEFLNAKAIKVLFLFVTSYSPQVQVIDTETGQKKLINSSEFRLIQAHQQLEVEEPGSDDNDDELMSEQEKIWKRRQISSTDQSDGTNLEVVERLELFKKKQKRLKSLQQGIVQGKINLRIEHIDNFIAAYSQQVAVPKLGEPDEQLPSRGAKTDDEWNQFLKEASFWAKINQVVGFDEMKENFAREIKLYEESVRLGKDLNQKILLLCGRPGVGKSFVATIIAQTLNRPLSIISMNGAKNTNIFKGTPQEVPGSNVGEILKAISENKHQAPVILLDEFEKCDSAVQDALGNIIDKTLNKNFKDNFFELPLPINRVIFVATANNEEKIKGFIRSRLLPIVLSPLSVSQRVNIAQKQIEYQFDSWDISFAKQKISEDFIKNELIYAFHEWGVRKLKENIADLAEQIVELKVDLQLPINYDDYPWKIISGVEKDNEGNCPNAFDESNSHKKNCHCFNGKKVEGWIENFGEYDFPIQDNF